VRSEVIGALAAEIGNPCCNRRGGVVQQTDLEKEKRLKKRDMVIQEIQASERLYWRFLM